MNNCQFYCFKTEVQTLSACHALALESLLMSLFVWSGCDLDGNSMFFIYLFLAECGSQSMAAVYRCL